MKDQDVISHCFETFARSSNAGCRDAEHRGRNDRAQLLTLVAINRERCHAEYGADGVRQDTS